MVEGLGERIASKSRVNVDAGDSLFVFNMGKGERCEEHYCSWWWL
jgi:hypothetical protein